MEDIQNTSESIHHYRKQLMISYGIVAGAVMAAVFLAIEFLGDGTTPFINFISYIPLVAILYVALRNLKDKLPKDKIFIKGLPLGLGISLLSALVLTLLNIVLIVVAPSHSFHAFGIEPQTINQEVMMTSIYFVETFVYGAIITFILLQFMKERVKY